MKAILKISIFILSFFSPILQSSGFETENDEFSKEIIFIKNKIQTTTSDTARINLLYKLAKNLRGLDNKEAEKYALQGLQISQNIRSKQNIGYGNNLLGTIKLELDQYVAADSFLNQAMRFTSRNNLELNANLNNSWGILNSDLDYNEQANKYFQKSVAIFSSIHKEHTAAIITLNIAIIYSKTGQHEKAIKLSKELVNYFESKNDKEQLIHVFNVLSGFYYVKTLLDSAEYFCGKSLFFSDISKNKDDIIHSYLNLGKIYSQRKHYVKSNDFLTKALVIADTLNSIQNKTEISKYLSDNYAGIGDSAKAYYFLSLYIENEKELNKQETTKILAKRELKEIQRNLKTNKELFYISLACLIISLLLIITLYLNFKNKKKANQLLVEMDELKSRLFSNITHEFRTPLTLILGPLEETLSKGEKRDLTRHEIKVMRKNANRLLNLVNQMLDLAKLDAKSLKVELSEADFSEFFKVNAMSFTSVAEQKSISYSWSFPKDPIIAYFDQDKLEKIISNLISNALKYTGRGGEVKCGLELIPGSRDMVKFWVSDSGKGIRKEHLSRIFDRFFQVEGTSGSDSFGTGIGLSLTKELITFLHGEITAESEWGTGSKFTVTLPLGTKHLRENEYILIDSGKNVTQRNQILDISADEDLCSSEVDSSLTGNKDLPFVLIVEDQPDIRNYISTHLKECYRMMESENGLQGYEKAVKFLPDLIITDLIMPEMNGMELCKKLKTDERTSHIPVIMLTARSAMEDKLEGLETGADQYLTKPFNMKEFTLLVRKLIEQRKKLRERFSRDVKLEPKDIAITPADEKFLNRALTIIETHMGDFDFEVNIFQKEMAMSRMQLFRKIKALTNQSPTEFIRTMRLKRAAKLIEKDFGNMAQISYEVGFNNPSYFAKCFKEMFNSQPSEYKKTTESPK